MALCAIAHHFGRPGTPTDQAWIESLNGHIKIDYPHLLAIRDPAPLRAELEIVRAHYNGVRLHQGVGYVTPNDEHQGRAEAIRKARQAGLKQARQHRLAWHRQHRHDQLTRTPTMLANTTRSCIAKSETRQSTVDSRMLRLDILCGRDHSRSLPPPDSKARRGRAPTHRRQRHR